MESPYYKETTPGANWFDLDDPSERLHGTQDEDFWTAYDPDVVDAPEDMPRVGNDHEELSNAKLSPTGYYSGFFAKDYQGSYVQNARKSLRSKKHHHHHHQPHRLNRGQYVQFDHDDDQEDYLYDNELRAVEKMNDEENVQFNHDGDSEDIDLEMPAPEMRGSARQRMAEDAQWTKFYKNAGEASSEEAEWDKTNVQLADNDDLLPRKKGQPFMYESELLDEGTEDKAQQTSDEIQNIMDE